MATELNPARSGKWPDPATANPNARQRHPDIWTAAYGAAFASHVSAELNDGHSFARSVAEAQRAVSTCFDIADAAVEAYEDELDRIAGPGASR